MLWSPSFLAIAALGALMACDPPVEEPREPIGQGRTTGAATAPAMGVRLRAAESDALGRYLVDSEGRPVYVLASDSVMTSTCVELCAAEWPPVPALQPPADAAGPGVQADLLGSTLRQDGRLQVTYAGRPLYYRNTTVPVSFEPFFADQWGQWSVIRPSGEPVTVKG